MSYANPSIPSKEETSVGKKAETDSSCSLRCWSLVIPKLPTSFGRGQKGRQNGFDILTDRGDALDSVTEAVAVMEERA